MSHKLNNNLNVLIFPSGSGVAKEIFDALKYIRWITIFGMDSDKNNFSAYEINNLITEAPFIKEPVKVIDFLIVNIKKYNIDCIYPAFDNIIVFLKHFEKELNVKIITSPLDTCEICFSKLKTYNLFENIIRVPKIININTIETKKDNDGVNDGVNDIVNNIIQFPVFIKPECGYGSRDSYKIMNMEQLDFYMKIVPKPIICEYLPGKEYTVDCFTSINNGLIYCEARERKKIVNGLAVLTEHIDIPNVKEIANMINNKLKFIGCWFFQVKYASNSQICLLEIAPRISGASALHRNMGANFPLLSIYEHFGMSIDSIKCNNYELSCYKCVENRFISNISYNYAYIDLDDTIIIKNKVNTKLIQLLYHMKNMNKNIILLSRNKSPIKLLDKYLISEKLFNKIIIVNTNINTNIKVKKSKYIEHIDAVFIDDSYEERNDVTTTLNIPVFNCDMVNVLFDEKL